MTVVKDAKIKCHKFLYIVLVCAYVIMVSRISVLKVCCDVLRDSTTLNVWSETILSSTVLELDVQLLSPIFVA